MAGIVINTVFKLKRGLAEAWVRNNPLLQAGEPGYELDTNKLKFGDGKTLWNDLPYFSNNTFSEEEAENIINKALQEAKESGEFDGAQGPKGDKGEQGIPGTNGEDGVSATHSWQGTVLTISSASGTSSANLKGEAGAPGSQGDKGADGISITKTEINENGELIIKFSNNTTSNLGIVVGAKGETGSQGEQGPIGPAGPQGEKGDTYNLTENDKQDIANLVLALIPNGDEVEY